MRVLVLLAGLLGVAAASAQAPGYFRHPAIHGDTVVFTAEGDLWSVAASGGAARRLTTHPEEESRAAISPDGSQLVVMDRLATDESRVILVDPGRKGAVVVANNMRPVGWLNP